MRVFIATCCILFCFSCTSGKKEKAKNEASQAVSFEGSWQLVDVSPESKQFNDADNKYLKEFANVPDPKASMISFFTDGSFTGIEANGLLIRGRWKKITGSNKIIIAGRNTVTIYPVFDNINGLQLLTIFSPQEHLKYRYLHYGNPLKKFNEDPYYAANNLWRVRPGNAEPDSLLQKRLGNYFTHLTCVLKAARERSQDRVTFLFSEGVCTIYNGGIGVKDKNDVPQSWVNTFYNGKDATLAYRMFKQYMKNSSFHAKGTGNWLIDDETILQNILNDLKNHEFPKRGDLTN